MSDYLWAMQSWRELEALVRWMYRAWFESLRILVGSDEMLGGGGGNGGFG